MSEAVIFDPANQLLTIAGERAQLSPKAFAVLTHLYQHRQQLVSKDDLLSAVWPKVFVTDAVLKVAVGEVRKALNDHPKQPRFIETVHRRGYRFIGEMTLVAASVAAVNKPEETRAAPLASPPVNRNIFHVVGRDAELQQLSAAWAAARSGQKQVMFVCAEAGLGKTALLESWLDQTFTEAGQGLLANAECFDQHGNSEPYLPILNALSRALKSPQQAIIKALLRQYAPGWYLQIPALIERGEQDALKQELFGVTPQRMLREFVDFIVALSQQTPLLLCIEDLHWCDTASLDLMVALAQRQNAGCFMLLASFRASESRQSNAALQRIHSQLSLQQQCQTIHLAALDDAAVKQWLRRGLPKRLHDDRYLDLFCQHTEGNPLLLSAAIEYLYQSAVITTPALDGQDEHEAATITPQLIEQGISGGLKHLLSLKTAYLDKSDRQVLEAASVSACEFATESLAAVLQKDVLEIEEACEDSLSHEQWLAPAGSQHWPDGSMSECYRFWHQLYRQFFYESLSAARCRHYHLRFAERLLAGYQHRQNELAAQLAYHFAAGGDQPRALEFRLRASEQAAQRFAYTEAIRHIRQAIDISAQLGDTATNLGARKQYCAFLLASGQLPEVIAEYQALISASQQAESPLCEIETTLGLADALFWVDRQACLAAGQRAVDLSLQKDDPSKQIHARGKLAHFCSVVSGYQPQYADDYEAALKLAKDSGDAELQGVHYPRHLYYLIIRSRYQQANELAAVSLQIAQDKGDAVSYLSCEFFHAWALFYQGQWGDMLEVIERSLALAQKNEHIPWILHFQLQKAWLLLNVADYAGARQLCLPIHQQACAGPRGSLYFFSLIILLQLETLDKNTPSQASASYVDDVLATLAEQPLAIDWVLRFSLQQGLAEYYLQRAQWSLASEAAQALKTLADCSGEQTYQALAESFLARCALAEGQEALQQKHLNAAAQYLQQAELPLVSWRIHALQQDWQNSAKGLAYLLAELASAPALQASFQQSDAVRQVLTRSLDESA